MSNNSSLGNMTEPDTPNTDYSEVPEAKSLLPPLPDTVLKPSQTHEFKSTEQDDVFTSPRYNNSSSASVFSTPPRRSTSRFQSINTLTPTTPRQIVTPVSGTGSEHATPRSAMMSPSIEHHTPTTQRNTSASSPFSPVIPIDERFGVSLAEPDTMQEPASPMEKLRHYEMCQRFQDTEFTKTCDSMKNSGWMSQKELLQLQKAKDENWRRWEVKVKAARKEVSLVRENSANRFVFSKGAKYHPGTESPTRGGDKLNGLGISSK